jgi:hypothetical protein
MTQIHPSERERERSYQYELELTSSLWNMVEGKPIPTELKHELETLSKQIALEDQAHEGMLLLLLLFRLLFGLLLTPTTW